MAERINVFLAYAHEDEKLLERLKRHLSPLIRPGLIDVWYDRVINAGEEWQQEIKERLDNAHLILLLVSPNFVSSDYCYRVEMRRAIERHERGEARVIPIILRPVIWQSTPFGKLQALPKDAKPVTKWPSHDDGFFDIVSSLKQVIENLNPSGDIVLPSKGNYSQGWTVGQPGCLIFLLDQSDSMSGVFGFAQSETTKRKCDMAARVINELLNEWITMNSIPRPDGSITVRRRADIAVLGYSDGVVRSILDGALVGRDFVGLDELQGNHLSTEMRKRKELDELGQPIEIFVPFPIWVKSKTRGNAPICTALLQARDLAAYWAINHPSSYPPIIINITDGQGIGIHDDPTGPAHELCQVSTIDGQALLYNVLITSLNHSPIDYPVRETELPNDPYVKQFFSLSSIIPGPNRQNLEWLFGRPFPPGTRGFIFNGYATSIRCMFNFASSPTLQTLDPNR